MHRIIAHIQSIHENRRTGVGKDVVENLFSKLFFNPISRVFSYSFLLIGINAEIISRRGTRGVRVTPKKRTIIHLLIEFVRQITELGDAVFANTIDSQYFPSIIIVCFQFTNFSIEPKLYAKFKGSFDSTKSHRLSFMVIKIIL